MEDVTAPRPQPYGFPSTLWTQIVQAQQGSVETRRKALDTLLRSYWLPVYASIRFGWNKNHDESKDLTQSFITDLLEREFWVDIDPSKGRFRSYLKAAVRNFLLNDIRANARLKRGSGEAPIPLEYLEEWARPAYEGRSPEEILDMEWIRTVLTQAIQNLQEEYGQQGKSKHHEIMRLYYGSTAMDTPPTYRELAVKLSITEADVRYYLHEVRTKLRATVIDMVRAYAADENDLNEEIRFILH